jgi:hypothetical protein
MIGEYTASGATVNASLTSGLDNPRIATERRAYSQTSLLAKRLPHQSLQIPQPAPRPDYAVFVPLLLRS